VVLKVEVKWKVGGGRWKVGTLESDVSVSVKVKVKVIMIHVTLKITVAINCLLPQIVFLRAIIELQCRLNKV